MSYPAETSSFTRRQFIKAGSALSLSAFFTQSQAAPNTRLNQTSLDCRPNLLFLNLDQLSHMALSCHGNPHVNTPNICLLYTSDAADE